MRLETTLTFSLDEFAGLLRDDTTLIDEKLLLIPACRALNLKVLPKYRCSILKKSIDARKKSRILITIRVCLTDESESADESIDAAPVPLMNINICGPHPVVIGFGPCGMFAALTLARRGLSPVVIERGSEVSKRINDVERYFADGILLPYSNVQFGEGGAGTFSDGKLSTGISDPRKSFVLETFVEAGAPPEIKYLAHPHIGTDRLRQVVLNIRKEIISLGGTFLFERQVVGFESENNKLTGVYHASSQNPGDKTLLKTNNAVLAIGHSARDTFEIIHRSDIPMSAKPFSVGLRIEHLKEWINRAQYGVSAGHRALPQADYKLVSHTGTGRALYTFCMCPGGFVVASASADGQVVTNGMSNFQRDAENSNSAILVGVEPSDFENDDIFAGVRFQENLERLAFESGGRSGKAPCQRLEDYLDNRASISCGLVKPSYRPGVKYTNLRDLLPGYISATISEGIQDFNRKMPGFAHPDSLLTGIETRSSSPVRINRDESMESEGMSGLYPSGEGAGYAGGIMSSSIDGIRTAEKIIDKLFA